MLIKSPLLSGPGGHHYSGASSTGAPNIQLDLENTFRGPEDLNFSITDGKAFVRTSVSHSLGEFNTFLGSNNAFIPHGECTNVHLGGHVQTGGYGQLIRSFGLLGDYVVSLELVDNEGNFQEVTQAKNPELYYAILGGSPGNLGVITHFTIMVHQDKDYDGSLGMKAAWLYNKDTLNQLLNILAKTGDDADFPQNYDFAVNVLSQSAQLEDWIPQIDGYMRIFHPEIFGEDGTPFWPRVIVVYAQWVKLSESDVPPTDWFDQFSSITPGPLTLDPPLLPQQKPMSQLTKEWIFGNIREFDHPYIKSVRVTNSTTLVDDGWAAWMTERIDGIVAPDENGCYLSAQLQYIGGNKAKFTTNANNGTSYSWRQDTSLIATLDVFYDGDEAQQTAQAWHDSLDTGGIGVNGKFCKDDRRLLWGSFGEFDLNSVWQFYYENQAKYKELQLARQVADPNGVFTPNTFCVAAD